MRSLSITVLALAVMSLCVAQASADAGCQECCSSSRVKPAALFKLSLFSLKKDDCGCGSTQKAAVPQKVAPKACVPQKAVPQKCAPQKVVPQKCAPQKAVPQKCAPQKVVPQKCAPQKCAPQKISVQKCGAKGCGPRGCYSCGGLWGGYGCKRSACYPESTILSEMECDIDHTVKRCVNFLFPCKRKGGSCGGKGKGKGGSACGSCGSAEGVAAPVPNDIVPPAPTEGQSDPFTDDPITRNYTPSNQVVPKRLASFQLGQSSRRNSVRMIQHTTSSASQHDCQCQ